jgi:hypothetical protein
MKKYRIELLEEQMKLICYGLEDVSRFASGQCGLNFTIDQMLQGLSFEEQMIRRNKTDELLKELKKTLLPKLYENESLSYNGSEFIGNTYQIYRTMMHQFAIDNNWDNVYSSPALASGNLGTIKIELIK